MKSKVNEEKNKIINLYTSLRLLSSLLPNKICYNQTVITGKISTIFMDITH